MDKELIKEIVDNVESSIDGVLDGVSEGNNRRPFKTPLPSEMRAEMVNLYGDLRNHIDEDKYNVEFNQDHIRITMKLEEPTSFNYAPFAASMMEHMMEQGIKLTPLPEIKIKKDLTESVSVFGRTGHYSPEDKEIGLYVMGRHPKDVLRSLAHELVHHSQNLDGRLSAITTSDTNDSDELRALEEETYAKGNILFRTWEDKVKKHFE